MKKKLTTRIWAIWIPSPGFLDAQSFRASRRNCIREYTAFYTRNTKPRLTWRQLYSWGWRCVPVTISFKAPPKGLR